MKNIFNVSFLFILLTFASFASLKGDEPQTSPTSTQWVIVNHTDWMVGFTLSEALENNIPYLYPPRSPQFSPLATIDIEPHQTYTLTVDLLHNGVYTHVLPLDRLQNGNRPHLLSLHTEIFRQNKQEFLEISHPREMWFSLREAERTIVVDHQPIYQIELFEKMTNRGQSYIADPIMK